MSNLTTFRTCAALLAVALVAAAAGARAQETKLQVTEYGVGTAVKDKVLEGKAEQFPEGTRVWFWTRVEGGADGDRIRHVWIHDGKEVSIGLAIGGPHWRTWSNKMLYPGSAGQWSVEARDADDRVLARQEFVCTPAPAG